MQQKYQAEQKPRIHTSVSMTQEAQTGAEVLSFSDAVENILKSLLKCLFNTYTWRRTCGENKHFM